jgi:hypothetical protein
VAGARTLGRRPVALIGQRLKLERFELIEHRTVEIGGVAIVPTIQP